MQIELNALSFVISDNKYDLFLKINPNWFYNTIHRELWTQCMVLLRDTGSTTGIKEHVDQTNLHDNIKKQILDKIIQIERTITVYTDNFVDTFREYFRTNQIAEINQIAINQKFETETKERKIREIVEFMRSETLNDDMLSLQQMINEKIENIESGSDTKIKERSIKCEVYWMRRLFNYTIRPVPYIIAAPPGFCKTSLLINILLQLSYQGKTGMMFSWEDSLDIFRDKFIAIKNQWTISNVIDNEFTEQQKEEMKKMYKRTCDQGIFLYNEPCSIYQLVNIIEKQLSMRKYDWIALDYLTLIRHNYKNQPMEIMQIMIEIVRICNKHLIPFFVLSQIKNIEIDTQETYIPRLKDLFGSSSIEQLARNVIMLGGDVESDERTFHLLKTSYGAKYDDVLKFDIKSGYVEGLK